MADLSEMYRSAAQALCTEVEADDFCSVDKDITTTEVMTATQLAVMVNDEEKEKEEDSESDEEEKRRTGERRTEGGDQTRSSRQFSRHLLLRHRSRDQ